MCFSFRPFGSIKAPESGRGSVKRLEGLVWSKKWANHKTFKVSQVSRFLGIDH
jgi:hypothetical protein